MFNVIKKFVTANSEKESESTEENKSLDKHEDYLIHKLADLLRLSHKELIEAKLKVKQSSI